MGFRRLYPPDGETPAPIEPKADKISNEEIEAVQRAATIIHDRVEQWRGEMDIYISDYLKAVDQKRLSLMDKIGRFESEVQTRMDNLIGAGDREKEKK